MQNYIYEYIYKARLIDLDYKYFLDIIKKPIPSIL